MGKKRNQYTKEYKIEAVRLIVEEGRPLPLVKSVTATHSRHSVKAGSYV